MRQAVRMQGQERVALTLPCVGYMPYVLISTGGVVLSLTLLASGACLLQHHNMMLKNGMTRYKQDLVRRKDKVKARKADYKPSSLK